MEQPSIEGQIVYAERIQIINYGPIEKVDIKFPFDEAGNPKPVLLVGENGSGKTILLSHIVNGLIYFKNAAYPETREVDTGKIYKIRSGAYIKQGKEFYFSRVDFDHDLHIEEIRLRHPKQKYKTSPVETFNKDVKNAWNKMISEENDYLWVSDDFDQKFKDVFSKICVQYFPFNRFEEPAWLNERNLSNRAKLTNLERTEGHTSRKIIDYSPLRDNQNWLFDIVYDKAAFELRIILTNQPVPDILTIGDATNIYKIALQVVRNVMKNNQVTEFRIGNRHNRVVSLVGSSGHIVPNIFQLSSGETSLLNLFLSILRDFEWSSAHVKNAESVRGIAVVDEIDLHLHSNHQYEILPKLIAMFPKVQFIVTTHSPLFVLGMRNVFGEDGFGLYRLPDGEEISPEEFSEFEAAYKALMDTSKFQKHIQTEIENAQQPVVCMEGETDVPYLEKAAELLDKADVLDGVTLLHAGGAGSLDAMWKNLPEGFAKQKVILLYDCDEKKESKNDNEKGNLFRRFIPMQKPTDNHPLEKGIENLFEKPILEAAHGKGLITITTKDAGPAGTSIWWGISHKIHLCDWICKNSEKEDFKHFETIFDILEEILKSNDETAQTEE